MIFSISSYETLKYTVGCGIVCTFQISYCWRGSRDLSRDNSWNPAGFWILGRFKCYDTYNTPLIAKFYTLFRFQIADVDLVVYHAIIHEIMKGHKIPHPMVCLGVQYNDFEKIIKSTSAFSKCWRGNLKIWLIIVSPVQSVRIWPSSHKVTAI